MMRALGVTDLPALRALEARSQPLPWTEDQLLLELLNERALVLGLDAASTAAEPLLVGYACLRSALDELWILNIAVDPAYRRRGHGLALLAGAESWGRARGLTSAWLEVRERNAAARALYEAVGFTEQGRRRGYYPPIPPASARETAIVMSRVILP